MRLNQPDVVVVGGGIAGASLSTVLARSGIRVLLLERQRAYRDRVRGEYMAPWGVLEARALGLEDVIRSTRAVDARYSVGYDELVDPFAAEAARRDNSTVFPGVSGGLCASHPRTCQALADDAARSGVEVVSGAAEVRVQPGRRPSVTYRDGREIELRPRLVIGADGRTSTVRKQSGIRMNRIPATHVATGLLVEGAGKWPDDQYSIGVEGDCMFFVFPQGDGRLRLYICHANEQAIRWAGRAGAQRFIEAFAGLWAITESLGLGLVTPAGPCGTFGGDQTWCDEPCADGVVLAGDAGAKLLEKLPQLTSLSLRQEGRLTDEALKSIAKLPRLKSLALDSYVGTERLGWMRFSAASIRQLKELKELESLRLVGQEVAEHDHDRSDHQDRHQDRVIARAERIDEEKPHAWPTEHRLRHQRAADQER